MNTKDEIDSFPSFPDADEDAEPQSSTPEPSPQRSSPLSYRDHSEVQEDEIQSLVRNSFVGADDNLSKSEIDYKINQSSSICDDDTVSSAKTTGTVVTSASKQAQKRKSTSGPRGGVYEPFPLKLHRMLATVEEAGLSGAVSWKTHGRAFQVNHVNQFVQTILPKFFRQTKLTSFQRQLNLYGFRRIIHGTDSGAYYHELFLRGKPFLCRAMVRTKVKGKSRLRASDLAGTEPDFYKMPPLALLTPDDYKKSKNVFFSSSEQDEGEDVSPNSKCESIGPSTKRRRSLERFDPFDPFSEESDRPSNDPHQHWGGNHMHRKYPEQSSASQHYLDNAPMPPVAGYPPSVPSSWQWQGLKPEKPVHSNTMQQDSSGASMRAGQMNHSMSDRMSTSNNGMASRNQSLHPQQMYGGMMPYTQNMPQNPPPSANATNPYYYPVDSAYGQQQNSLPMQHPYWNYHQFQSDQIDYNAGQDEQQNQYNTANMPPSSLQQSTNANYSRESFSSQGPSQHSLPPRQPNRYNTQTSSLNQSANSGVGGSANASASVFQQTMSPMKLRTTASGEQIDTIELEVDGDMKDLLNAFINKKKEG
jgi:hypothetical protein